MQQADRVSKRDAKIAVTTTFLDERKGMCLLKASQRMQSPS
jgi:hypothetical protein